MKRLVIEGVSRRFGGLQALRDCSFTTEPGRITCMVGPNGAGKTTIFNVITGFLRPDAGRVSYGGQVLTGLRPPAIVAMGVARTFQNLRLFADLTVADNLMVAMPGQFGEGAAGALLRPLRTAREGRRRREEAHAILEQVGLGGRGAVRVRSLSYGDQKLLCIGRLLATGAELLLLDEPTSGLAGAALESVMALMRQLQRDGRSLLVVEHNTRVVQQIADDVLFLHQGHLLAQGTAERITADPALGEIYFGGSLHA